MPNTEVEPGRINPELINGPYIHVVAAIIWNSEQSHFLIAKRQKGKHLEDYWEFPGGKLEKGESRRQALQRELLEEINIQPVQAEAFIQVYHQYSDRNILLDCWIVREYEGQITAREQQDLAWIKLDQIGQYKFPQADLPILDALQRTAGQ